MIKFNKNKNNEQNTFSKAIATDKMNPFHLFNAETKHKIK